MGFLDGLNPLSLASDAAESLCDALLPKDLEFVGDLAGLALDFNNGNWVKCLSDAQDLLQDLPQQLAHLAAATGPNGDALMTPSFLEPTPPPAYGSRGNPPAVPAPGTPYLPFTSWLPPGVLGPLLVAAPPAAGQPPVAATTTSPVAAPVVATTTAPGSAPVPPGNSTSANAFFAQSDVDIMNALRNGNLPDAIKNDPLQMRRLDARISEITQMNALITNMLKALHDMNAQVIQNLRV